MTNATKQRPVQTLRDGSLKAAIWKNESENGPFFNVTFGRTFKTEDGTLKDSDSFSGTQLLQLAHLAEKAYDRARKLTRDARAEAEDGGEQEDEAA